MKKRSRQVQKKAPPPQNDYEDESEEDFNYGDYGDLPEDFEDEEIDEDEAFGKADYDKYNFPKPNKKSKQSKSFDLIHSSEDEDNEEDDEDEEGEDLLNLPDQDSSDEESDDDDSKHKDMIQTVTGKRKRTSSTNKPYTSLYPESEYNIDAAPNKQIKLNDIMNSVSNMPGFAKVRDQLVAFEKTRVPVMVAPLPGIAKDQLTRKAIYSTVKKDLTKKWDSTIRANRMADVVELPTEQLKPARSTVNDIIASHTPEGYESQILDILSKSGISKEAIDEYEKQQLEYNEITAEQVKKREDEVRKMRRIMYFAEIKHKRRAKIKSKKYRKMLRKDKEKKEQQNERNLEEADPMAYAEEQQRKIEQTRALERATQRHKNTGKWAKSMLHRQGMDKTSRQAISEQLRMNKDLLKKQKGMNLDNDDDDDLDLDDSNLDEQPDEEKGLFAMEFMKRAITKKKLEAEKEEKDALESAQTEKKLLKIQNSKGNQKYISRAVGEGSTSLIANSHQVERTALARSVKTKVSNPLTVDIVPENKEFSKGVFGLPEFEEVLVDESKGKVYNVNTKPVLETKQKEKKSVENKIEKQKQQKQQKKSEKKQNKKNIEEIEVSEDTEGDDQQTEQTEEESINVISNTKKRTLDSDSKSGKKNQKRRKIVEEEEEEEKQEEEAVNPWLTSSSSAQAGTSGKNKNKGTDKVKRQQNKMKSKTAQDKEFNLKLIDVNELLNDDHKVKKQKLKLKNKKMDLDTTDDADDKTSRKERVNLLASKNPEQKKLIKRAFEGDDVVAEFEKEKAEIDEQNNAAPPSDHIPGWGNWTGAGVTAQPPRKRVQPAVPKPFNKSNRKSGELQHVIINNKKNKSLEKYLVGKLPYGFQSREQYELSLVHPLGKEWNTRQVFSASIKPRVKTKAGQIIKPLSRPLSEAERTKAIGNTQTVSKPSK